MGQRTSYPSGATRGTESSKGWSAAALPSGSYSLPEEVNRAWAKWQEEHAADHPRWRRVRCAVLSILAGVAGGAFTVAVLYYLNN